MAAAAKTEEKPVTTAPAAAPPKGFEEITIPEIDAWYNPREGVVFTGQIVHYIEISDPKPDRPKRPVVLVKLSEPTDCGVKAGDKSGKPVQLAAGQCLAVSIRYRLNDLLNYVEHKGECWVQAIDKKDIGRGQTMWNFRVATRGKKAPPPAPAAAKTQDDLPF